MSRDPRFDGQFFIAVKSTGIFCRPICPARLPQEKNVDYYLNATQAMSAGFRPCLRCRPDSAPGSWAWLGADTTAQRALTLLVRYPEQSVDDIAQRMGISARYLYKLVVSKVGIAPKKYRLYSQVLFAKRLLQQTSLSILDVALAAGFSSARRLQANMQHIIGLAPASVRKTRQGLRLRNCARRG